MGKLRSLTKSSRNSESEISVGDPKGRYLIQSLIPSLFYCLTDSRIWLGHQRCQRHAFEQEGSARPALGHVQALRLELTQREHRACQLRAATRRCHCRRPSRWATTTRTTASQFTYPQAHTFGKLTHSILYIYSCSVRYKLMLFSCRYPNRPLAPPPHQPQDGASPSSQETR